MTPVKQVKLNDCLPACLASILEIPLSRIPNFPGTADRQLVGTQRWLKKRGLTIIEIPLGRAWRKRKPWCKVAVAGLCIISVKVLGTSSFHAVVGAIINDGLQVLHDPCQEPYSSDEIEPDSIMLIVPIA